MAEYDGFIRIGTGIETKEFKAGSKEIETEARRMAKTVSSSLGDSAKIALQKQTDAFVKMNQQYAGQEQKIKDLGEKLHELQRTKVETPVFKETSKELVSTEKRLENFYGTLRKLEQAGGFTGQEKIKRETEEVSRLTEKVQEFVNIKNRAPSDSDEYKKANKELTEYQKLLDSAKSTLKEHESINKKIKSSAPYKNALAQINIYEQKVQELRNRLKELETSGKAYQPADTSKIKQEIAAAEQKQMQMYTALQTAADSLTQKTSAQVAEEERLDKIRVNAVATNDEVIAKVERIRDLEQEIADLKEAGIAEGYADYEDRILELSELKQDVSEYRDSLSEIPEKLSFMRSAARQAFDAIKSSGKTAFSGLFSAAKKAFSGITRDSKKSSTSLSSSLKTILKYTLGIRSLYVLFNKFRSAVKEGFSNLAQYSAPVNESISMLMSSLTQLKNSLATAFAPILTTVAPALKTLIDMLSRAATYVGMFIATLTGAKTFTKAIAVQEDYAASLNGTASAAKKAAGALARFDDLDVLNQSDTSGGGANAGDLLPEDMFEEVPIENKIISLADKFKSIMSEFFSPLKEAWNRDGEFVIDSWKYAMQNVQDLIKDIGKDFLTIWNEEATISFFSNALHVVRDIFLIVGNLTDRIRKAWNTNNVGLRILEKIRDIFATIVGHIRSAADFTVEWSKNIDFYPLLESIRNLLFAIDPITDIVFGGLEWAWKNVLLPMAKWTIEEAVPAALDAIGEALELISTVAKKAAPILQDIWDNFLSPLAEIASGIIVDFLDALAQTFKDIAENEAAVTFLTGAAIAIGAIVAAVKAWSIAQGILYAVLHASPLTLVTTAIAILISIITLLITYWDDVKTAIQSFWDKCIEIFSGIGEWFSKKFDQVKEAILSIWDPIKETISNIWEDIKSIIEGIIDFIVGVFTLDWEKAWDGVVEIFEGVYSLIADIVDPIISAIELVLDALKALTGTASESAFKNINFGSANGMIQTTSTSFSNIPALASGAVIRGGNPFMAILGDQRVGQTNIEAPLSTIEKAVENVMSRIGNQNEVVPVNINLNWDGETFARLSISDILSELARQGYNVDLLGYT